MSLVKFDDAQKEIGVITLNDPDTLNAMSLKMAEEFSALVESLKAKSSKYRVLILTGAGRAFSAGGDLEMLLSKTKLSGEENRLRMLEFYNSFLCIRDLGIPLIAALNGHAIGAGLCLASGCDIRIGSDTAKLGFTFSRLGLHPGMGATWFVPQLIGQARASELLLTGRVIDAQEAFRIGIVSKLTPSDDVMPAALATAKEIGQCGPEATRQLLESLRTPQPSLNQTLQREALCQGINYASEEFLEGVQSVKEKRAAGFAL